MSKQSPKINKIANNDSKIKTSTTCVNNAIQKRKVLTNKNEFEKRKPNNKSIFKPSILNEPNIRIIKQEKKGIRDARRKKEDKNEIVNQEMEVNNTDEII